MKLLNGDCEKMLRDIPDSSVDMVMTSPPYDNLREYNNAIETWNFEKFKRIAKELYRVLVEGGGNSLGSK